MAAALKTKQEDADQHQRYVRWFGNLTSEDVPLVGGKNASLGEMISSLGAKGVRIPDGFATTSQAYWDFIDHNQLKDQIADQL